MKTINKLMTALITAGCCAWAGHAWATNGTWSNLAGGSWANSANWSGGIIAAGTDATANFGTLNLSTNATVTLDGARTVGNLIFDDQNAAKHNWTLNTGSAGPLALAVSSGTPTVTVGSGITNTTIALVLDGSGGLAKAGAGTLNLAAADTFAGALNVDNGILALLPGTSLKNITSLTINNGGALECRNGNKQDPFGNFALPIVVNSGGAIRTYNLDPLCYNNGFYPSLTLNGGTLSSGVTRCYMGNVTISALPASGPSILGPGSLAFWYDGTTLQVTSDGSGATVASPIDFANNSATCSINVDDGAAMDDLTIAGNITSYGAGLWTKDGDGQLTLTGTNYDSATVTINAGTLQVGNGGSTGDLGSALVTINSTLAYDRSDTATLINSLSGSGTLVQKGTGTLVVASTNSQSGFYGTVAVNAGTLAVAGDLGYPSTVMVNSGGTLAGLGGSVYASVNVNNGGSFSSVNNQIFSIGGSLALGNTGSDAVALNFSGNGSGMPGYATVSGSLDIYGAVTINFAGVPITPGVYPLITYASPGANSGTIIQPSLPIGTVGYVTNDTSVDALELVITKADGLLWVGSPNNTWNAASTNLAWQLASSGIPSSFVNHSVVGFNDSASNFVVNVTTNVQPASVTVNATNSYTFQGGAVDSSGSFTKSGSGMLTLLNTNNFSSWSLQSGTMSFARGSLGTAGAIAFAGDATLQWAGNNSQDLSARLNFGGATSTIDTATNNVTFANAFGGGGGSGTFVKAGTGTLNLAAADTFSGALIISNGILALQTNVTLKNITALTINNGGALECRNGGNQDPFSDFALPIVVNSGGAIRTYNLNPLCYNNDTYPSFTLNGGTMMLNRGASTNDVRCYTGNVTISALPASGSSISGEASLAFWYDGTTLQVTSGGSGATVASPIDFRNNSATCSINVDDGAAADDLTISGNITVNGPGPWTKDGDGQLTLTGTNYDPADVTINAGTLQVGNGGSSGDLGSAPVTVYSSLAFDRSDVLTVSNVISGSGEVVNLGAGVLTLAQANAYTGPTIVSNGTVLVNGSLDSGSAVTVAGGKLGGTGAIGGSVTVNSGGLSPGVSIGTLTINGALTLATGSTNTFEVNGSTLANDSIVLGGAVTYGGTLNIVPTGTFSAGQNFTLFSGANAASASNFASITGSPGNGLIFNFTNGVLSVKSSGLLPVTLTNAVSGGVLSLSWPAGQGWRLEWQTNALNAGLRTNWIPLTGGSVSSTNITIDSTKPTVFYRLVNP